MSKSQIRKMVSCCFFHYASGWTVVGCVLWQWLTRWNSFSIGWDCGVFESMYSYFLLEDLPLFF
jgi:hypothetical protein